MSRPFRLTLQQALLDAMIQQAQAELPNECCGLLAGTVSEGHAVVLERYPLVNALASPREYSGESRGLLQAHKAMRASNSELLAIYHSHPTSAPIPSKTDLERNYSPDVMHFIISLVGEEPEVKAWWLDEQSYELAKWSIG